MGKHRIIAETGAGQHGVATATACALLGLECIVYMGTEDMRRQAPNVLRMELLGAEVAPSTPAPATLKEAISAAIRDWVANVGDTHYVIGSCVGPAPYPALVRDLQRVIGDEARAQILEQAGRLPDRVIACVGGGSNAIGIFARSSTTPTSRSSASRRRARGSRPAATARRSPSAAAAASCTAPSRAIMQDEDGQILEAHSISAGLDYPGTGPEHAWLRDTGRARYVGVTDADALAAFRRLPSSRASSRRSSPRTPSPGCSARAASDGGHDRPDLPVRPRRQGPRRGARQARHSHDDRAWTASRRRSRPRGPRRADAVPDGRLPDVETSVAVGLAYADAGADLIELGVPFSDPLADGPVIHAAATQGAAARAPRLHGAGGRPRIAELVPVVLMCYANPISRADPSASPPSSPSAASAA